MLDMMKRDEPSVENGNNYQHDEHGGCQKSTRGYHSEFGVQSCNNNRTQYPGDSDSGAIKSSPRSLKISKAKK